MPELRYHVAVARRKRRSLLAWLQRKDKPLWLDYAPCGQCHTTVTGWEPNIEKGAEYTDNWITWKDADRIRDVTLLPCRHLVDRCMYVLEGFESALVDLILEDVRNRT